MPAVGGKEPGRFAEAGLVVTSWLQDTSRDGDPQDHSHNQVARITRTVRDDKWRALDTASLLSIANDATPRSPKGKDAARVDWDALAARWDATLGGQLAGIAATVPNACGPDATAPSDPMRTAPEQRQAGGADDETFGRCAGRQPQGHHQRVPVVFIEVLKAGQKRQQ